MKRCHILGLAFSIALAGLLGCGARARYEKQDRQAVDHFSEARKLQTSGDLDAALAEFKKAIAANPSLASAHAAMGDIYRKQNDLPAAATAYESAVKANPENFRNNYNAGYLHQTLAQSERLLAAVKEHLVRAIELYAKARELRPNDYGTLVNLGVCYYRLGQYDQAENTFRSAVAIDPYQSHAYTNLGAIYDAQGEAYQAVTMYRQSLERDSRQPEVLMNLAAVYVRQGKYQAALRDYQAAQSMMDDPAAALERLGYCHYHMGEYEKAEEYYLKALKFQPANAEARCGLGIVYMTYFVLDRTREDMRDQGLSEWRQSLESNPEQPNLIELMNKYAPRPATATHN